MPRISKTDFGRAAEFIKDEYDRRKGHKKRKDKEKHWKEVDRQLAMEPDPAAKIKDAEWRSNLELPHQSQALEVLVADAKAQIFPKGKNWFQAHSEVDDEFLGRDFSEIFLQESPIEEKDVVTQENIDRIVEADLQHNHSLYEFRKEVEKTLADAFKYGFYAARGELVTKPKFDNAPQGVFARAKRFPAFVHSDAKSVYPDDRASAMMHEGIVVEPGTIKHASMSLADLKKASKGSKDPTDPYGGWMPKVISDLEGKDGQVQTIEWEGDLTIQRSGENIDLTGVIVLVAVGNDEPKIVRYRERGFSFHSHILGDYHNEQANELGVSPLMKGRPIQVAMCQAFNRMTDAAILNACPPVAYEALDSYMAAQGGPPIEPNAIWAAMSSVTPQIIGNPDVLMQIYLALKAQFEDVTGVNAPRLGAQTKSHQTRFAVSLEAERGVSRTVDFTQDFQNEALLPWLNMSFEMTKTLKARRVWVEDWQSFIEVGKKHLPENVMFEVFGAAGPLQEQQEEQKKLEALMAALNIEPLVLQAGGTPMDLDKLREEILKNGGWTDPARFFAGASEGSSPELTGPASILGAAAPLPGAALQAAG